MSLFSERLDLAIQVLGYPMAPVAMDLARIPNLTEAQYIDLLNSLTEDGRPNQ